MFDLDKAASSKDYCDEIRGVAKANGIEVTELSTHLQGQLVAVHPAYDEAFDGFAAPEVRGNPACLLYTSPSPRDLSTSRMPSSA